VACSIEVPVRWFVVGATLQVSLPRLLSCARCDGGGCDACERRGAFEQQLAGIASEVAVVLPRQPAKSCNPVCLRLPAVGARAVQPELPPGHLLLTVLPHAPEPGWAPASNVQALGVGPAWGLREWVGAALVELGALRAELRAALPPELGFRLLERLRHSRRVRIWAALAVLVTLLCFWLLRRS
jgi:hypothetical protein